MKYFTWLVAIVVGMFSANAQAPSEKTLLWEVSGHGIVEPSFLFGTLHLICPDELKMPDIVKQKFRTTKQLFFEIDMDDPKLMTQMMQGMQMRNDTTLPDLMKKDFDSVSVIFKLKTGIPLKMMNSTKPFLLLSMVYPAILGCAPVSWEGEFIKLAKQSNKEVNGLEDVDDQIKVFDQIPYTIQASMFVKALYNLDSSKQVFNELVSVYKEKDIKKMLAMTMDDKDFGAYEDALLNTRNRNWIPVIGEQAKKMPTFFAFGAGHLAGEQGIISLLRKSGFRVKPIHYKD